MILPELFPTNTFRMYQNSSFYTVGNILGEIETNLNQDLKKVTKWCIRIRMFINKIMLLCTRQERMNLGSTLKIIIDKDDIGSWDYNR